MGRLIYTILMLLIAVTSWVVVTTMEEHCARACVLGSLLGMMIVYVGRLLDVACEDHRKRTQKRKAIRIREMAERVVDSWRNATHRRP